MSTTRTLHCTAAALLLAGVVLGGAATPASARYDGTDDDYDPIVPVTMSTPVLAVVGLAEQRITIYDAQGKIMEAPVSTGQTGLETPAGIFSVVQKEEEHHSNLFDDASMPFMERITWTGISLHAGVLPGYAASHGCVRMPHSFAEKLYDITKLGMRVLIVRQDIAPAPVEQPAMFTPAANTDGLSGPGLLNQMRALSKTKYMDSIAAQKREREAKAAASKRAAEMAAAVRAQQAAETAFAKAEAELKDADHLVETAAQTAQAESAKAQARTKLEAARAQLEAAKAEAQAKSDASHRADEDAHTAAVEAASSADASEQALQSLSSESVFISRKTQRLYVRRNNLPVYEGPVSIRNADKPIGSFVFTALDYSGTGGEMRWNVVSMYKNSAAAEPLEPVARGKAARHVDAAPADVSGAQSALNRIVVPEYVREHISAAVLPGSSLIISDEGPSLETGKDTDFVVVMSGDPMGGLTSRHHPSHRDGDEFVGDSFFGRFSSSSRRGGGGGGFPFFFSE